MYDSVAAVNALAIPIYLIAAVMLSIYVCVSRPRGFQQQQRRRSRTPLLAAVRKRTKIESEPRSRWWQFWRRKRSELVDEESGLMGAPIFPPPQPQHVPHRLRQGRRAGNAYGTFFDYDDFPQPANLVAEVSIGSPLASSTVLPRLKQRQKPRQSSTKAIAPRSPRPASSNYSTEKSSLQSGVIPARPESFADGYEVIRKLNWSNGNALFLVRDRQDGKPLIIKQICGKLRSGKFPVWPKEANMLDALREHPGMLTMVDHFCDTSNFDQPLHNIVTEFADGGDIDNLILFYRHRGEQIPEAFILHFAASMIHSLAFMHYGITSYSAWNGRTKKRTIHRSIVHRDLKPANVFLEWDGKPKTGIPDVIIGDLGLANYDDHTNTSLVGTKGYLSPEVINAAANLRNDVKGTCSKESDMWGLGMILYELLTLRRYQPGQDEIREAFDDSTVSNHKEVLELLERCLAPNPQERPKADKMQKYAARFQSRVQNLLKSGNGFAWPEAAYSDEIANALNARSVSVSTFLDYSGASDDGARRFRRVPGRTGLHAEALRLSNARGYSELMESLEEQFAGFSGEWAADQQPQAIAACA